jgi:hypothetical protein
MLIQSAKLSPTVVHRILMTQNHAMTSGTLLNEMRDVGTASERVVSVTTPEGIEIRLKDR